MLWFWLGLAILLSVPVATSLGLLWLFFYLKRTYLQYMVRIFQEKPLFVVPRGQPVADAEDLRIPTSDGLTLAACYLRGSAPRRGVLLFGLEFGSNRWACVPYCEYLLQAGYDVFCFEPRNQGDSDRHPGYDPLQWVTDYEIRDTAAALAYLKARPDVDPRGIGFFGISKGGGAGLFAASRDPWVRCCVTDGVFGAYTTLVPYMRLWFRIYNDHYVRQALLPSWYYGSLGMLGLHQIERERHCRFPHLEPALSGLQGRPLLMIHGGGDTYIKPDMARSLFARARPPKEFWLVEGAKHNQAFHVAGDEYRRRVLEFFRQHLGEALSGEDARSESSGDSLTGQPAPSVRPPLPPAAPPQPPVPDAHAARQATA